MTRSLFALATVAALAASNTAAAGQLVFEIEDAEGAAATVLLEGVELSEDRSDDEAIDVDLGLTGETAATVYVTAIEGLSVELEVGEGVELVELSNEEMEAMLEAGEGEGFSFAPVELLDADDLVSVFIDNDHREGDLISVFIDNDHRTGEEIGVFIDNDHRTAGRYGNAWRVGNWALVGRYGNAW